MSPDALSPILTRVQQFILILPFISCVTFIIGIFRDSIPTARLACMLSISSLIASAYNLRGIPIQAPGPSRPATLGRISTTDSLSPAQKYIPMLNAALSMLLALWGFSFRSRGGVVEGFWMMCWLPLINFGMIQMARKWAVDVDPSELEKLKYDFRGA